MTPLQRQTSGLDPDYASDVQIVSVEQREIVAKLVTTHLRRLDSGWPVMMRSLAAGVLTFQARALPHAK